MIHVATVHWRTDRWIGVQEKYLRKHLKSPYQVYAWFNDVTPARLDPYFFACFEPVNEHEIKLNILADIICSCAESDEDILIFLDGDAFPVADVEPYLAEKLPAHKLVAVQRRENNGDTQPHPCFCATTVGFWKRIKGDWKRGHKWKNGQGEWITDPGGNLLKLLEDGRIDWHPMLRSNRRNPHPVLFGVYDALVYHHGAGFRGSVTRLDEINRKKNATAMEKTLSILPWYRHDVRRKIREENRRMGEEIFGAIQAEGDFVNQFL
ncbi:MAG TPA: hypothetical protein VKV04_13675 [Verrucomicrobiae bacterium]|nr:hypothetical protein [Verrucomicrobiae bacterium]